MPALLLAGPSAAAAALLLLAAPSAAAAECVYSHLDHLGDYWTFNLTALAAPADYVAILPAGGTIATNVCKPPATRCAPVGATAPAGTSTAVFAWGPAPAPGAACPTPPCTQACTQLGWGALGGAGAAFSLIDPADPWTGVRVTHTAVHVAANGSARDAWGNPRPPQLTVDFTCDTSAAQPAPLEPISIQTQQPGDTALRLRTAAVCFDYAWQVGAWGACLPARRGGGGEVVVPVLADVAADAALAGNSSGGGGGGYMRRRSVKCAAPGTTHTASAVTADATCAGARPDETSACGGTGGGPRGGTWWKLLLVLLTAAALVPLALGYQPLMRSMGSCIGGAAALLQGRGPQGHTSLRADDMDDLGWADDERNYRRV